MQSLFISQYFVGDIDFTSVKNAPMPNPAFIGFVIWSLLPHNLLVRLLFAMLHDVFRGARRVVKQDAFAKLPFGISWRNVVSRMAFEHGSHFAIVAVTTWTAFTSTGVETFDVNLARLVLFWHISYIFCEIDEIRFKGLREYLAEYGAHSV